MRNSFAIALLALLIVAPALGANTPPPGFKGNIVTNGGNGQYGVLSSLPPGATRGFPSNDWTSFIAIGDCNLVGCEFMDNTKPFPFIIGSALKVAPQYESTTAIDQSSFQADQLSLYVYPGYNPQTQNNPLVLFFPNSGDPGYGGSGGSASHEAIVDNIRQAGLAWLTVPQKYKLYAQNTTACTTTGTWTNAPEFGGNWGLTSSTNGSTISCTITSTGSPDYVWYKINGNDGGTFTYQLNSGTVSSNVPTQGPANNFTFPMSGNSFYSSCCGGNPFTVGMITIPAAAATNTINLAVTSTTTGTNTVSIYGVGTAPPISFDGGNPTVFVNGQYKWFADAQEPWTTNYNTDIKNDVAALSAAGLAVNFIDVRNSICCNTSTDILSSGHNSLLSPLGHKHIADVYQAAIQADPNDSNSINPKKYGAVCNGRLFTNTYNSTPNFHTITTTSGSNVISISGYTVQPGAASCSGGGGDGGEVISIFNGSPVGPTTYISAVTTSNNTLTLAPGWAAASSQTNSYAIIEGCPSDPNNWATAHDDTAALTAALTAQAQRAPPQSGVQVQYLATVGGSEVKLPPNCGIHELVPPPNSSLVGGNPTAVYSANNPNDSNTPLYFMTDAFGDDSQFGIDLGFGGSSHQPFKLKNVSLSTPAFPYLGYQGITASCIGGTNFAGPEGLLIEESTIHTCPVGVGYPFGRSYPVTFTAQIVPGPGSQGTMTVSAITSTNFNLGYEQPWNTFNTFPSDWLASGRGITGTNVPANEFIVSGPAAGGAGTYIVGLSASTSSEAMTSPSLTGVMSVDLRSDEILDNGIGLNGDISDSIIENTTFTGNQFDAIHMGPRQSNSGTGANHIIGGRFEENGCGVAFDSNNGGGGTGLSGVQMTGVQFQFNSVCAWRTLGPATSNIEMTGGWLDGNAGCFQGGCAAPNGQRPQVYFGGSVTNVDFTGVQGNFQCFNFGGCPNTNYLAMTQTGASVDYISVNGGDISGAGDSGLFNWTNAKPTHLKVSAASEPTVDTTLALTATSTGFTIGALTGGILNATTSATSTAGTGIITLTIPTSQGTVATSWNCAGGDQTTHTQFGLGATTSTSAALFATSTVTSGDIIGLGCTGGY